MKKWSSTTLFAIIFVTCTVLFYTAHYFIFKDPHHIFIYLVGDIAFLPVEVLLVTVVLHRLLERHEKKHRLQKLNMVIGSFFTETGTDLLSFFGKADAHLQKIQKILSFPPTIETKDFDRISKEIKTLPGELNGDKISLIELRDFLKEHRPFLLGLMENPNLLEHETFTDLLMAVFHLTEELINRKNLKKTSKNDKKHLVGDMERAYVVLVQEWLHYMKHLKEDYPYLFSFALRTNPFDDKAQIEFE